MAVILVFFFAGFPRTFAPGSNCADIVLSDYKWVNDNCGGRYGYICKKRGNILLTTKAGPKTTPSVPQGSII